MPARSDRSARSVRAILVACLLVPAAAEAQQDREAGANAPEATARKAHPLEGAHWQVRGDLGAFSAVGFGGLSLAFAPSRWFLVEAGLGGGLFGLQASLMPKVTLGSLNDRVFVGAGVSVAIDYTHDEEALPFVYADAGYEHRFDSGFSLSIALGYAVSFFETTGLGCGHNSPSIFQTPQGRIGVGSWF